MLNERTALHRYEKAKARLLLERTRRATGINRKLLLARSILAFLRLGRSVGPLTTLRELEREASGAW